MAFDYTLKGGVNYWFVQSHGGSGVSGVSHSANLSVSKIVDDVPVPKEISALGTGENRSTTSTTSTNSDVNPNLDWLEGSHL